MTVNHNKMKYYYVWIEGLSPKRGEKLKSLTDTGYDETTLMSDAMRVKPHDLHIIKAYLKRHGVSNWCLENPNTFQPIKYAPAGTIFNSKGYH